MKHNNSKRTKLDHIYYKYLRPYFKYIPIVGIIILFILMSGERDISKLENSPTSDLSLKEKVTLAFDKVADSFIFNDWLYIITTAIILITIWTGYKYWLRRIKYVRRNDSLLEKLVIVSMFMVFIIRHIKANSMIGKYADWGLFLLFLYLVVAGSWFLAKTIDTIDLSSDLYCWGLRLIGAIVIFFGIALFMSSTFAITLSDSKLVLDNIYWIASLCIMLLGAFMEYRSFRRHPAIHVW